MGKNMLLVNVEPKDKAGETPLDLATSGGHEGLATFLTSKGGTHGKATVGLTSSTPDARTFSSALPFKTLAEFERESKEPCVILEGENVSLFAPKRREKEARIVFGSVCLLRDIVSTALPTRHRAGSCPHL